MTVKNKCCLCLVDDTKQFQSEYFYMNKKRKREREHYVNENNFTQTYKKNVKLQLFQGDSVFFKREYNRYN